MTKHCGRCGRDKPTSEFHRRRQYGWQAWCRTCRREYDRDYHQRTRPLRIAQKKRYRLEIFEWYRGLKMGQPCADCGGRFHYSAMEFDHRPGTEKTAVVSTLVARTKSRKRVLEEIAKCDLVCANCHAVRTYERVTGRSSAW